MLEFFLLLLVILIALVAGLGSIYSLWIGYEQWKYMNDTHKMLFLSSANSEIDKKLDQIIAKYLPDTNIYNLVELGCGKAVVLKSLAQRYQWKSVTGIEGQKSVWIQAWLNCNILPKSKIINTKKIDTKNSPLEGWQAKPHGVDTIMDNSNSNQKIQLLNQNIFDYQSQKPTFHYCYLGVKLMKGLYEKGKFADSIVVSLDYEIEGVEPLEVVELETKGKIQKQLLIYRIT